MSSASISTLSFASRRGWFKYLLVAAFVVIFNLPSFAIAENISVMAGKGSLQSAIDNARSGDVLQLQSGVYYGEVVIDKALHLQGQLVDNKPTSIIDSQGIGRVITIDAENVIVHSLMVKNSGDSLATEDSGIFVTAQADNALIQNNHLEGNLIGVNLKGPSNARVANNIIYGSLNPHMNERGNAIHIWNADGAIVENNQLIHGRDGIFVTTAKNNTYRNNRIEDMRFAIHYMYTNNSTVSGNISIDNHSSFALMFSNDLDVYDNVSIGSRDRGILLNFVNHSSFRGNRVVGGTDKCVFIYNANDNMFRGNHFEDCNIGIHFTAGSEKNTLTGNSFIDNRHQVKYVGTRDMEWSSKGVGNYWSDNTAFDLNNDGIADAPYQPNDLVDQIVWRYPLAKLLLNSPATQMLKWAQSEFPLLHPGGVVDSAALMAIPTAIQ